MFEISIRPGATATWAAGRAAGGERAPAYQGRWQGTTAVGMATCYGLVSGRAAGVLLHSGAGLLQGASAIHGAQLAGVPMLVCSSESTTYGEGDGPDPGSQWYRNLSIVGGPHTPVSGYVKWANQVGSVSTLPGMVVRAVELARLRFGAAPLHRLLGLADVTASGFVPALRAAALGYPAVSIAIPAALIAIGVYLVRSRPRAEKMVIGVAAGFACVALAVKIVVEPAIANTLSLKHFTAEAMKTVDGNSVGYLIALNYDVAFYSGRDMPIVTAFGSDEPKYLIGWRHFYESMRPEDRKHFIMVLKSGPTALNGGDAMVLLKRVGALPGKSANPAHAPPRYSV